MEYLYDINGLVFTVERPLTDKEMRILLKHNGFGDLPSALTLTIVHGDGRSLVLKLVKKEGGQMPPS